MVKPITIKIDDRLWEKFKTLNKKHGVRLETALDNLFREGVVRLDSVKRGGVQAGQGATR